MRILHIVNKLSNLGNGIVNLAVDVAIVQQRAGHTVAFLAGPDGGYEDLLRTAGVELFFVQQENIRGLGILRQSLRFRQVLRQFRPDVIHAHMQTGLLLMLPWARLSRTPLISHLHNVHDAAAHRMGWADRVIAVSGAVEQSLREQGVPAGKIRTILNGTVGSPRLPAIADLTPEPLLRPSILTVAGMTPRKGIPELLEAFDRIAADLPDVHLYLAGDGPQKVLFEQTAALSPFAARIHFLGFNPAPHRLMLAADVFILASRRDSFGLVLAEARDAGCAIIASDVDGIPEALDFGRAGILVPPQSPQSLAEAALPLLRDPALRQHWQRQARIGIERFTVARMAEELMTVYREVVPSGGAPHAHAAPPGLASDPSHPRQ